MSHSLGNILIGQDIMIIFSPQAGIVLAVLRLVVARQLHLHCLFCTDWLKTLMECLPLLLLLLGECQLVQLMILLADGIYTTHFCNSLSNSSP